MYYICKFSDSWSIYDGLKNISRPLEPEEISTLKKLFPGLLNDNTKILNALKVENINPNKLLQLPMPEQMSNNGLIK